MLIKDFLWAHDPTRDFIHFIKKILHNDYKGFCFCVMQVFY